MVAGIYDGYSIEQGATFTAFIVEYVDSTQTDTVSHVGMTARMQLRTAYSDPDVLLELTTENGGLTLGGANGRVDISISAAQTAALTSGTYVYDIELVSGSGANEVVRRLLQGNITVKREVTR